MSAAYDAERTHVPPWDLTPRPDDGQNLALSVAKWEGRAGVRRTGQGATLAVACENRAEFNEAVTQCLVHPERLIPGAHGVPLPPAESEGVYATQFADGVLYYNRSDQAQAAGGVDVPAKGIAWGKAGAVKSQP